MDVRPIATAPRDGRRLLLYVEPAPLYGADNSARSGWFTGWWDEARGGWYTGIPGDPQASGWLEAAGTVTGWADLP